MKKAKCVFLQDSVTYLGHKIDRNGVHTTPSKVEAINKAPKPQNQQQLKSFLGLLHYYGKFIPSLSTILHPLNQLLKANARWKWSKECDEAFEEAKQKLVSAPVLAHYDPTLPLRLAGDASSYGVGAVISHIYPNGQERPIAYASRTLSSSERNYAQLEKEALSLIFGIKKFHQYLYGRTFTIYTDHKPLTTILSPSKGIPDLAAARLRRWALILAAYNYSIEYKSTRDHANADGLSRLPIKSTENTPIGEASIFNIKQMEALPVTAMKLRSAIRYDKVLSKVLRYTKTRWPAATPEYLKPYKDRQHELTVEDDCLLWGVRVVVPLNLREQVIEELHQSHPGIVRMKSIARSYFWWPKLDKDIEVREKSCIQCKSVQSAPPPAPLHPWIWPSQPWDRIHIDYAGPFLNRMYLVVVDAHSKWPEIIQMSSTTAERTIEELRKLFSCYGLPRQLVSDNGPQFVAEEFQVFLKKNGIKHIRSAPYHPSSNGLAERFVQSFKRALTATGDQKKSIQQRISTFLLTYRSTNHGTTGIPPCELFLKRPMRTVFDLLRPDVQGNTLEKQVKQKEKHDRTCKPREFVVGEEVMARNFRGGKKWLPGTVVAKTGPISYEIEVQNSIWKRHVDQLQKRLRLVAASDETESEVVEDVPISPGVDNIDNSESQAEEPQDTSHSQSQSSQPQVKERRYPQRQNRKPPDRYSK